MANEKTQLRHTTKRQKRRKETLMFIIFVVPALAFVLFATDIPFIMNIYYSVFDWNGVSKNLTFVGLANFKKIFTSDKTYWTSWWFTLRFTFFYVIIVNAVSLLIALMLAKENRLAQVGRAFYYVPYIVSLTAISLIWEFILGPAFDSLYNSTGWSFFGMSWMGRPNLAFIVLVVITVWQNIGFYMINYIAGIVSVPRDYMEAATIDGASKWQAFWKVMFPLIMPSVSICLLTSLTFGFKLFDIIMVFTKGGPVNSTVSVAYNIYTEAFRNNHYGAATAKSLIFVIFILIFTALEMRLTKKREVEL